MSGSRKASDDTGCGDIGRGLKERVVACGNIICITRPRRFGKTVMANMIASFFSRTCNSADIFNTLDIGKENIYTKCRRDYPVIHIPFNDVMGICRTYEEYIGRFEHQLITDLRKSYPGILSEHEESAAAALLNIYAVDDTARFIFVIDEWDFIFHQPFITEEDKRKYLLLKLRT